MKYSEYIRSGYCRRRSFAAGLLLLVAICITEILIPERLNAQNTIRFAIIGDYGNGLLGPEGDVATLVKSWDPDLVLTVGDNNYPYGAESTIDENIGLHYSEFIYPYVGGYGAGDTVNRFFPAMGNHDWITTGAAPYLAYFDLPGNERYYDIVRGPVHFFIVDSDGQEPDGNDAASVQAGWLQAALGASTAPWKLVLFHHTPYSSGTHGSIPQHQWPYKDWGADAVIVGHDHDYERLSVGGLTYFVNGLGGRPYRAFNTPIPGSVVRFTGDYGAMLVDADTNHITFQFITRTDSIIDSYSLYSDGIAQVSIDVDAGWNLVSVPLRPLDASPASVFPTAIMGAFYFDSAGYHVADTLTPGQGYWMKFGSTGMINIGGFPALPDTVPVYTGWNLVGGPTVPVAAGDVVTIPAGIVVSQFFRYDGSYARTDSLRPGKAYWVKVGSEGGLVLK